MNFLSVCFKLNVVTSLSLSFFLHLHKVFCGTVGNLSRCEFVLMGSSINLSARLMKQCSVGMILVDELVYRHCSPEFRFEEECKIIAKGSFFSFQYCFQSQYLLELKWSYIF